MRRCRRRGGLAEGQRRRIGRIQAVVATLDREGLRWAGRRRACGAGGAAGDAFAGASAGRSARASAAVLGGDRAGRAQRRGAASRRACRRSVGVRWFREGGGMPPITLGRAVGAVPVVRRARGDRGAARRWLRGARGRAPAGSVAVDDLAGAAAQRRDAQRPAWTIARRRRSGMPTGARGAPSRPSSRSTSGCVAMCRTGWLARVQRPDGVAVGGPEVAWIGRRRGRRRDRRWARSWSPEQISNRLRLDFPDDESMRDLAMRRSISRCMSRAAARCKRELTACLRTGRALRVPRARARGRGKGFVTDEVMISQRPAEAADRAVPGPLGRRPDPRPAQLGDRHAGRAHQPVHDAAAPAADGRPRRPQRQERPGADRSRRRSGPRRDRRRDRRRCPNSCAGR